MLNNKLFLILGDQLFQINKNIEAADFVMIESRQICERFNYHKQKLTFVLACMREHRDLLIQSGLNVNYYDLKQQKNFEEVFAELSKIYDEIVFHEISDKAFSSFINSLSNQYFKKVLVLESPQFLTSKADFQLYLSSKKSKRLLLNDFYIWQRKRLNLLLDKGGDPLGGSWNYDADNRKKLPKSLDLRPAYISKPTSNYFDARQIILEYYPNNPGVVEDLWLPTNYQQAQDLMQDFFVNRLADFGTYEDSLSDRCPFLFHSTLSPVINNGLLTPNFVLQKLLEFCDSHPNFVTLYLNSVEGFVRQIIGWREWVKGLYDNKYSTELTRYNFFEAKNNLTPDFYFQKLVLDARNTSTVQNLPLQLALEKVEKYGYNHHIERLMVLGNWMLLNEFEPIQCYQWFMEMYIDAYDWVMVPNVFGMALFADGGIFATKPYIAGGNYLKKMADYKISKEIEDLWTNKFWEFLLKHKAVLKSNPRLAMLISSREKKLNVNL